MKKNKKKRNTMGRVVSGFLEGLLQRMRLQKSARLYWNWHGKINQKLQNQSEKSKLTPSNIVKPKQKRQKDWRRRQALVYNHLHNLAHATFMSVRIQNWQTLMMKQLQGQKNDVSTVHTRFNSLFVEYGVIVRNLNYRPWQWVYSISCCKSFPGCF